MSEMIGTITEAIPGLVAIAQLDTLTRRLAAF
jgi:hypothetical protein